MGRPSVLKMLRHWQKDPDLASVRDAAALAKLPKEERVNWQMLWADVAELLRTQRQLARLSLRHLAKMTSVSDSYLSQVERGLYEPSPEVLKSIAEALNIPISGLYERLGWLDDDPAAGTAVPGVEEAIDADEQLTKAQKHALLEMYRTLIGKGA